jgi:hypothetical protein
VLAIWNGIASEAEEDFVAWHVREHIPERVAVPGFLRGRRYVAADGFPKYFNFYETRTSDDLLSPDYQSRLNAPTAWTLRVVPHFRDTSRTICDVAASVGNGDGGFIEALRLSGSVPAQTFRRTMTGLVAQCVQATGIVAAHLLQGRTQESGSGSVEKKMRARPDEVAEWILLIEGVGVEPLIALRGDICSDAALTGAGAAPAIARGCYQLQFALSRTAPGIADAGS